MCLLVGLIRDSKTSRQVAKEDIVCYKVLTHGREMNNFFDTGDYDGTKWYSPYRRTVADVESGMKSALQDVPHGDSVDVGIHSFESESSARYLSRLWGFPAKVFKCVIPKGAEYYEGIFELNTYNFAGSFASSELRFIEELK